MNLAYSLNTFTGSALIIILTFAECASKYSSDRMQKRIFCAFLLITFLSLITDFLFSLLNIVPKTVFTEEKNIRIIINYIPLFFAVCVIFAFRKMYKQITLPVILFLALFTISVFINIMTGSVKLIWPFMAALLLSAYLFIIMNDAKIDSLTGIDNRFSFNEFTSRISRQKTGSSWDFVLIDIDNFKLINNAYGHLEGDNALCALAEIIRACVRKTDFAARYGGDEFILAAKTESGIENIMPKIKEELSAYNEKSGKYYNLEIIYGIDTFASDGSISIEEFLNHFDRLIRKDKEAGRRSGDYKPGRLV
jgi:diguanylate cyclase (GGDEF)-like protein